mmetsp:Transcript_21466/g.31930  ORF Transcript_21466/g.31930 Transcript_21466/m.31930 type:complete len:369 (+) Transcript_21466:706-1812(+)
MTKQKSRWNFSKKDTNLTNSNEKKISRSFSNIFQNKLTTTTLDQENVPDTQEHAFQAVEKKTSVNNFVQMIRKKRNLAIEKLIRYDINYRPPVDFIARKITKNIYISHQLLKKNILIRAIINNNKIRTRIQNMTNTNISIDTSPNTAKSTLASHESVETNINIRIIGNNEYEIRYAYKLLKRILNFDDLEIPVFTSQKSNNDSSWKKEITRVNNFTKKHNRYIHYNSKKFLETLNQYQTFLTHDTNIQKKIQLTDKLSNKYKCFLKDIFNLEYKIKLSKSKKPFCLKINRKIIILWNLTSITSTLLIYNRFFVFGKIKHIKKILKETELLQKIFYILIYFLPLTKIESYVRMSQRYFYGNRLSLKVFN